MASASWFSQVEVAPPIEVFALTAAYNADTNESKVNLGVGAYRNEEGKPWVLPVVRSVESHMAADTTLNHEYLPVAGLPEFRSAAAKLLLGENSAAIVQNRVDGIQAIGGTGAVRIGMDLLRTRMGHDTIYMPKPTWPNHKGIANALKYAGIKEYRYWNAEKRSLDIDGMLDDLKQAPDRAVVLLHACAHNPTGIDPTPGQWQKIASVIKEKHLFPFFDCAYQGFSSGDLDKDAAAVRYFVEQGFEVMVAQSFSKNFGLYNERIGQLLFVVNNAESLPKVRSQLEIIVRQTWSNPPAHGGRIVATVLNNQNYFSEWKATVKLMADRILLMRQMLYEKLKALGTPGEWSHIIQQTGMFSYTGLNERQVQHLVKEHHIYLMKDGRINMCGLTTKNMDYVANAVHEVVVNVQ